MMRSHESPMDFQYENPIRPDPNSPFRLTNMGQALNFETADVTNNKKRQWHESPSKPLPFSFNTPRTIPNAQATFTPSTAPRFSLQDTPGTDQTDDVTDEGGPSDPDSPIPTLSRSSKRNKMSDLAKIKLKRRRRKHLKDLAHEHYSDEEDLDDALKSSSKSTKHSNDDRSWNLKARSDLPYIASGYLQLIFNLCLLSVLLYFLVSFILTIQADVNKKVEEYSAEILSEISICSKEYLENRCSPDQRVPAMQMACQAWEKCMDRDPALVGRARVSAETFAEIVNSLIEPISYKTMIFCLVLLFGSLFISNFAFGILSHQQSPASGHYLNGQSAMPATFMIQAERSSQRPESRHW